MRLAVVGERRRRVGVRGRRCRRGWVVVGAAAAAAVPTRGRVRVGLLLLVVMLVVEMMVVMMAAVGAAVAAAAAAMVVHHLAAHVLNMIELHASLCRVHTTIHI